MGISQQERKQKITELYRTILEREPDDPGLNTYLFSDISIEHIEEAMRNSLEYLELQRRKNFGSTVESLGTGELLLMGSSPRSPEHIKSLNKIGVKSLLNLDIGGDVSDLFSGFEQYLNVPVQRDEPIPLDSLDRALNFLYDNVVVQGRKTFVFSEKGIQRAPMMIALFLVAEKKYSFKDALSVILAKQNIVNPGVELVNAEVLQAAKAFQFSGPPTPNQSPAGFGSNLTKLSRVKITSNLSVGMSLSELTLQKLREDKFDTILDLNTDKTELPSSGSWFSHVHIPMSVDQLDALMKVALRSANKYASRGKVHVLCKDMGMLMMFSENYMANFVRGTSEALSIGSIRAQLMSL